MVLAEWEKKNYRNRRILRLLRILLELRGMWTPQRIWRCNQKSRIHSCGAAALHQSFNRDCSRYVSVQNRSSSSWLSVERCVDAEQLPLALFSSHFTSLWWNSERKRGEFVATCACVYVSNGKQGQKNVESCSCFCSCQINSRKNRCLNASICRNIIKRFNAESKEKTKFVTVKKIPTKHTYHILIVLRWTGPELVLPQWILFYLF